MTVEPMHTQPEYVAVTAWLSNLPVTHTTN